MSRIRDGNQVCLNKNVKNTKIPKTIKSSFNDINVPRICDGEVSAIYNGAPCIACEREKKGCHRYHSGDNLIEMIMNFKIGHATVPTNHIIFCFLILKYTRVVKKILETTRSPWT